MSVVVAYVATRLTANAINFQNSLKQFGWMSVRLGADQKWEGWSGRMKLYIEYLKSIDPQQFVILCDADDVLFLRSPDHMNDILMNIDNKILISTESVCSFNCEPVSSYWNRHGEKPKFNQYVNGGGQMGKAFKLLELFTYELETYPADDQIALSRYVNAFPDSVILDSDESVFIIIGPDNLREIDWTDRSFPSLLENNERVRPFLIHLPSFPVEASFSKLFNFDSRHDTYYRALSNRINDIKGVNIPPLPPHAFDRTPSPSASDDSDAYSDLLDDQTSNQIQTNQSSFVADKKHEPDIIHPQNTSSQQHLPPNENDTNILTSHQTDNNIRSIEDNSSDTEYESDMSSIDSPRVTQRPQYRGPG